MKALEPALEKQESNGMAEETCLYLAKYLSSTRSMPEPNSSTDNSI
jgi:hypothetical protein